MVIDSGVVAKLVTLLSHRYIGAVIRTVSCPKRLVLD